MTTKITGRILAVMILLCGSAFGQVELSSQSTVKFGDKPCVTGDINRDLTMSVGDSKSILFKPELKIAAWGGECQLTVDIRTDTKATMSDVSKTTYNLSDKITMTQDIAVSHSIYKRDDGNLEWEIVLASKPDTNVFEWDIETSGYEWLYQPTVLEVPLAEGQYRPDSVEGSYAAYHASKANNVTRTVNGKRVHENYKTGKAFHLYRPRIITDDNKTIWGVLHVDTVESKMTITVPQKFLNDAKYPVTVDPTFGYSEDGGSVGAVNYSYCHREFAELLSTSTTDYQITEYHFYAYHVWGNNQILQFSVYPVVSGTPGSRLHAAETKIVTSGTMVQHDITGLTHALAQSTDYGIAMGNGGVGGGGVMYAYETNTNATSQDDVTELPASWSEDAKNTSKISMWATYEEVAAGGDEPTRRRHLLIGK